MVLKQWKCQFLKQKKTKLCGRTDHRFRLGRWRSTRMPILIGPRVWRFVTFCHTDNYWTEYDRIAHLSKLTYGLPYSTEISKRIRYCHESVVYGGSKMNENVNFCNFQKIAVGLSGINHVKYFDWGPPIFVLIGQSLIKSESPHNKTCAMTLIFIVLCLKAY